MNYERLKKSDLVALIRQLHDERTSDPGSVMKAISDMRIDYSQENFIIVVLDQKMHILKRKVLFKGGLSESIVDLRVLFKEVLSTRNASCLIIAHNHPSNNTDPSREDIAVTARLREACAILGLTLLDHIIFTETSTYLSLKEHGSL